MARQKQGPPLGPTKTFKYGMPLYGLAWPIGSTFFICGGGGSVSSGIKNRLVCAEAENGLLTDQTADYQFGLQCPMRMAMAPGGKSLLFGMGEGGIKRLDVELRGKVPRFLEITGSLAERLASITMDVKAIVFHPSGDYLALGGEDGSVLVYEWPSMKNKLDLSGGRRLSEEAIKDLDFAPYHPASGGRGPAVKVLVVLLDDGSAVVVDLDRGGAVLCRVQLATKSELHSDKVMLVSSDDRLLVSHLPPGMERVQFTRVKCFKAPESGAAGQQPQLQSTMIACLMNNRIGCHVALWELGEDGLLSLRAGCKAADSPGACLDVSRDGSLVAVGTSEGDVVLVSCRPHLRVVKRFPHAHMVFTTTISFSPDGSYVLSAALDASTTVNPTALPPPTDLKKFLVLALFFLAGLLLVLLQVVRVLKYRGMTVPEILALVGLKTREEL